jgi:hypothetical protein
MSDTTIEVPNEQVEALRETLTAARDELIAEVEHPDSEPRPASGDTRATLRDRRARLADVERLLAQVDSEPGAAGRRLTGSREALWDALYDAFCMAAERLEQDCNEYWQGEIETGLLRDRISELSRRLDLLDSLGPPPA